MRGSATRTTKRSDGAEQKVPGILYQGQGRYLNRHKGLGDCSQRGIPQKYQKPASEKFDTLVIMGCCNCDDPNHTVKQCSKQINVTKAAKRKMEYYAKKNRSNRNAHVVLFELCKQIDDTQEEHILEDDDEKRAC